MRSRTRHQRQESEGFKRDRPIRITLDLEPNQYYALVEHVHRETRRVGRKVTAAEIMRNALADVLGQQRPEPLTRIPKALLDSGDKIHSGSFRMPSTDDPPPAHKEDERDRA